MSTQIQRRRGTTAEHSTFTGADGELTVDTTKDTVVVHDATTVGGHPLQKQYPPLGSAAAPTYTFTGDTNTGIYSPGADQVAVATNGTGRLFVDASGRVGVGTSSPSYLLQVAGSASGSQFAIGDSSPRLILDYKSPTSSTAAPTITSDGEGLYYYGKNGGAGSHHVFHSGTSNTERLRIDSSGRVGIGISSPSGPLDVVTGSEGAIFRFSAASTNLQIIPEAANGNVAIRMRANSGAAPNFQLRNDAGSNLVTITNGGQVGIGTTSPVNVGAGYNGLTVNGSTGGTIYLQGGGTSGGRLVATSTDFYIGTVQAGGNLIFQHQDGSYERARIDSSGRLLVGTSTARTNYFPTTDALTPNVQLEASRGGLAILGTGNGSDLFIGKGSSVTAADDFLGEICFTGFDGTNNRTAARILCQTDAACGAGDMPGRLVFSTTADGAATPTEQLRITSDRYVRLAAGTGGIQFNGDTVAANALDDYEEGTFTPVIIGSITTGTATYSSQNGKYTKVGNRVFWEIYIDWTGGTGTGNLRVSGLPFTISNTLATFPAASIGYAQTVTISADHQLIALQASNNTYVYFYQIPSGGGVNVALDYDASGTMGLSGNYNVA